MNTPPTRVVLITGCSTGIGRATAIHLASRGWRVFATARNPESVRDLQSARLETLPLDVTDEPARVRAIDETLHRAGRLDALVNNAGINVGAPLELATPDDIRVQFETNVWGALHLAQLAIPAMRAQGGGRIVNISSAMGKLALPFSGLYAASMLTLEVLIDTMRWELRPWNIQVIAVEPGFVVTNLSKNSRKYNERYENHPLYQKYLSRHSAARQIAGEGSSALKVARVIERALTDRHPRARYVSGWDAQLGITVRWLLPDALWDFAMTRVFGLRQRIENE
jgi:NAD(P)-dependent dehydrogenase (short-subunit alcohol dehydrogenase family)